MITYPNRLARQAMARAQQSPTTAQMNAAVATAGVTAIRLTATLGAGGAVTLTFPAAYSSPPTVVGTGRFVGDRGYFAVPGVVTATTVALTGKRNKGTLLLSDGPNEAATSGDVVEVLVIGRLA
ncbi:hypothetical protein [Pseudomonas muyukensis]|uniref:Uncharacterized protein n=1 Tax=Pseudomonas muyukensis TaxID=2842357 RepID=A0ABX8M2M4_9PSED|nr:hypothetical protein [Pseudomonas muyukensis]QXH33152.1 hypothetical protein KSS95_13235 [Pseudomonas muyukensis]